MNKNKENNMPKDFYKIEDCDCYTSTNKPVLEIILGKIDVFKRINIYYPGPCYIFLDKKSYKELNYEFTKLKLPIKSICGFQIKIVKSKERIICVGV
jgi:hypothetical protein